jgi:hypothetical protein
MTDPREVLELLQIADLSLKWPDLKPIGDRALDKLRMLAKEPAHAAVEKPVERSMASAARRS